MTEYEFHPIANIFPMMESGDLAELAADIEVNGLLEPLVLHEGKILDGRNRYKACLMVGVEPETEPYAGNDPVAFVLSRNLHRRHLTPGQRAMIARDLLPHYEAQARERQAATQFGSGGGKNATTGDGKARDHAARSVGVSPRYVSDAKRISEDAPDIADEVRSGDKTIPEAKREIKQRKDAPREYFTLAQWSGLPDRERARHCARRDGNKTFNEVNENIEWAGWSWNPVTGCLHNCDYCYARDIANRFYPQRFEPSFLPSRLSAPANTKPRDGQAGRSVFVCSMADLFGKWVPREWIEAVLDVIRENDQWTYLLLTKFPQRYTEFDFPPHAWLGTSVDRQHAVGRAESAFATLRSNGYGGVAWVSCEPMMERLTFSRFDLFDWVVVGGASKSTQTNEYHPPFEDIVHLWQQARDAKAMIYMKTNLLGARLREYPANGS